jgi:hypothetical protein
MHARLTVPMCIRVIYTNVQFLIPEIVARKYKKACSSEGDGVIFEFFEMCVLGFAIGLTGALAP